MSPRQLRRLRRLPAPVGKVEIDSRGRNVWRDATGSTSVVLKRLENKDLALEPTQKVPIVPARDAGPKTSVPDGKRAAAKTSVPKPAAVKTPGAKPVRATTATGEPALQPDRRGDGSGFDPYNSR